MTLARKLAEGVGGWLQLEFHCHRSEVFSEKYLAAPIGQILSAEFGLKAYAEVPHPVLAAFAKRPGRKPEIDFAVLDPHPTITVAVESKWIGRSSIKAEHLLWDLIRLELLCHHLKAHAIFILGGRRGELDKFFATDAFVATNTRKRPRSLLRAPTCLNAPQL